LVLFVALFLYASTLEGWGAFVVAPLLRWIVLLSLALGAAGVVLSIRAATAGEPHLAPLAATALAGSVGLWFLIFWLGPAP
jgi:hypothetical protein